MIAPPPSPCNARKAINCSMVWLAPASADPIRKTTMPPRKKMRRPYISERLDAPLEVGRRRIAAREPDHFERERAPFFERVRRAYLERARRDPKRIKVIDAARTLEQVQAAILQQLDGLLESFGK